PPVHGWHGAHRRPRMSAVSASVREHEPLARHTSLELGGPARAFVEAERDDQIRELVARGGPIAILGGGSNLVVSDAGFDGLVIAIRTSGVTSTRAGDRVLVEAAAGEPWDALVERAVTEGLAGLECLSG